MTYPMNRGSEQIRTHSYEEARQNVSGLSFEPLGRPPSRPGALWRLITLHAIVLFVVMPPCTITAHAQTAGEITISRSGLDFTALAPNEKLPVDGVVPFSDVLADRLDCGNRCFKWESLKRGTKLQALSKDGHLVFVGLAGSVGLAGREYIFVKLGDGRYGVMPISAYMRAESLAPEGPWFPTSLPSDPPQRLLQSSITAQTTPQAVAQLLWQNILTKCGSSSFFYGMDVLGNEAAANAYESLQLLEFKDATFEIESKAISRAEGMNGLEWTGSASLSAPVYRALGPPVERGSPWSWRDHGGLTFHITKVNGEWSFYSESVFGIGSQFNPDAYASHRLSCDTAKALFVAPSH